MTGWPALIFITTVKKRFAYKIDFWVFYFGSLASNMAVAWYLWAAVYREGNSTVIRGYTLNQMVLYYLIAFLVEHMVQTIEHGDISNDIYEGGLNRFLIYPVNYFAYKVTANLAEAAFDIFRLFLVLGIWAVVVGLPEGSQIGPQSILMGLSLALFANIASYTISSSIELVSFWTDNVWSLRVMQKFIASIAGGLYVPLILLPEWAQSLCRYLPFSYMFSYPIRAFLGELTWFEWGQGMIFLILWVAVSFTMFRILWKRGLLQYTGIGI